MTAPAPKKSRALPVLIAVAAVAGLAWAGFRDGGWFRTATVESVDGWVAKRGRLDVTVVQRGNLSARNSAKVYSEVEGRNAILEIVEEGSFVNEGDEIVQLDVAQLLERKVAQDIAVQNAQAAYTTAEQRLAIQESQNASDIAAAQQRLDFAGTDLTKYKEGDLPNDLQAADEAITSAQMALKQAENRYEFSAKLEQEGFITRAELETDQLSFTNAQIRLDQAIRNKDLLVRFDSKKEEARFKAAVEEAQRELERVNLQAAARLVDIQADVRTSTAKLKLETEKYEKYSNQIEKATIRAPVAGYVVYRRTDNWRGGNDIIQKGSEVQERQEILSIPQAGGMIAEVSLHESVVRKVRAGMPVKIKVDALGGTEFNGEVQYVALVPDSGSMWTNPNLRQFKTTIAIRDGTSEAKPGMSCAAEILVETIEDALTVPVQAVHRTGGKTICFVGGSQREIEIGASSEAWVQVLSGLQEGEVVALHPPADFKPEPEPESDAPPAESAFPAGAGAMPGNGGGAPGGQPGNFGGEGAQRPTRGAGENGSYGGRSGGGAPGDGSRPPRDGAQGGPRPPSQGGGAPGNGGGS